MSGVKGMKGGGGKRPGAGRKPAKKAQEAPVILPPCVAAESSLPSTDEPLAFLLAVQNSAQVDIKTRVRAAIAAAQYKHTKRGDGGKKDEQADKAKKAGAGKFAAAPAPFRLVKAA